MIELSRPQISFAEGLIEEEVGTLWEPWMRQVDQVLRDQELLHIVYDALARRWPMSGTRGRPGTPADVVVRLLLLKHIRNWSYAILEREVRANLVYRQFTRVGARRVPDAKTLGKLGVALGPEIIQKIHQRVVAIAQEKRIVQGRQLRVDTTVVETDIHYPTDSSLLGDGVRVLTRTMRRIAQIAGAVGTRLRDRTRSVRHRVIEIARASRSRIPQGQQRLKSGYAKLLQSTGRVVGQAKKFAQEVAVGLKRAKGLLEQVSLEADRVYLERMIPLVQQVMHQTRDRIFKGNTHVEGKLVSLFEPHTEIIRKGKAAKPTEFGKMVKIQEAEAQIIIDYEVYDERPNDCDLLLPAVSIHEQMLGRTPRLVTADAAFFSTENETVAHARGVKRIAIPNRSSKSIERKTLQKKRWFRNAQKWRTGSEGRISLLKRRHGLNRCRYKGQSGVKRWVGLGVIADNLIHIGGALVEPTDD
ncbi:MAG: ISNCY family transposase [Candidatus Eremiobacteraeota bacterium]|nr:ISNCY family transposase [Candidatus Eremiobacteraeota bacterium]